MLKEKVKPCTELSEKVLNEMYSVGYSPKSVNHHVRPIYNRLARYCEEHFEGMYSVDAGEAFIREYYGAAEPPVRCGESHLSGLTEPPIDSYSA